MSLISFNQLLGNLREITDSKGNLGYKTKIYFLRATALIPAHINKHKHLHGTHVQPKERQREFRFQRDCCEGIQLLALSVLKLNVKYVSKIT